MVVRSAPPLGRQRTASAMTAPSGWRAVGHSPARPASKSRALLWMPRGAQLAPFVLGSAPPLVWFMHRAQRCSKTPLTGSLAAFHSGRCVPVRRRMVWRRCNKFEGRWLRVMSPLRVARGTPWPERAPAAAHAARTRASRLGFPSLWERRCKLLHSWAGHRVRAPFRPAHRYGHEMTVPPLVAHAAGRWRRHRRLAAQSDQLVRRWRHRDPGADLAGAGDRALRKAGTTRFVRFATAHGQPRRLPRTSASTAGLLFDSALITLCAACFCGRFRRPRGVRWTPVPFFVLRLGCLVFVGLRWPSARP